MESISSQGVSNQLHVILLMKVCHWVLGCF